jgi:hypothetical protein
MYGIIIWINSKKIVIEIQGNIILDLIEKFIREGVCINKSQRIGT